VSYLVNTNIISEVRKGDRANQQVVIWWPGIDTDDTWVSVLVVGENRKGIERARRRDPAKAKALSLWLDELNNYFSHRILLVDETVAQTWGRLNGPYPLPVIDSLLATTALVHGLTLVTRNARDVENTGVAVLNPWQV
jgi:predicted nucleic acid-binding protein